MRKKNLEGKTALVTGGNRGIGLAVALRLAELGVKVGICGRNEVTLKSAVNRLNEITAGAWYKKADVRSEKDINEFFKTAREKFQKLDICVPNAGEATLGSVVDTSLEDWNRDIDTNLTGVFLTLKETLIWMKETGGGKILPVLSQSSKKAFRLRAAYCASKWGALGLVESARFEAKDYGVEITALLPASVATDFQKNNPAGMDWMLNAEDVADAAEYALSVSSRVELPEILIRCGNKNKIKK